VSRASRRGMSRQQSQFRRVPRLEFLEDRLAPAILTVNSLLDNTTANDGLTTLREAIQASVGRTNGGTGNDIIRFSAAIDGGNIGLTTFINDVKAGSTMAGPSAFRIDNSDTLVLDGQTGLAQGITIKRDSATPFRLFDVYPGASLTLKSLTL